MWRPWHVVSAQQYCFYFWIPSDWSPVLPAQWLHGEYHPRFYTWLQSPPRSSLPCLLDFHLSLLPLLLGRDGSPNKHTMIVSLWACYAGLEVASLGVCLGSWFSFPCLGLTETQTLPSLCPVPVRHRQIECNSLTGFGVVQAESKSHCHCFHTVWP